MRSPLLLSIVLYLFTSFITVTDGVKLIIHNNCNHQIWPGILASAGQRTPNDGGFELGSAKSAILKLPNNWSGRLWARQGCAFDHSGKGSCETGDCSGRLHCQGMAGTPPATVVEMTFGSRPSSLHYYDVSLVDGFNLPVSMKAVVGGENACGIASCGVNLNGLCPSALKVKRGRRVVGCKSACLAMESPKYCCTGEFSSPGRCRPTVFSSLFKAICPRAYSYAFDDVSSLHKCNASAFVVTFCPPT